MLRNGHTLTVSAGITGIIGLAYWSVAARGYTASAVGEGSAAVSALMLIAGVSQFNFMSMLMRFVPTQGSRGRRLVLGAYGVSVVTAAVLATAFVLLAGRVSAGLAFFESSRLLEVAFVVATVLATVSVLQDAALTAVRRPGWVVVENGAMAVAKIALVAILAVALPRSGIVVSWAGAILVSIVVANVYLFRGPLRKGSLVPPTERANVPDLVRYVAPDYLGELLWLAATSGVPLIVVARIGTTDFAYFGVAWTVTFLLDQAVGNLGYSLIVEGASRPEAIGELWVRVVRHLAPLLTVAVVVLVVGAPWLLLPFGGAYASHGSTIFRLLALAALPGLVTSTAVNAARAQRKTKVGLAVLGALCTGVIVGSVVLLPIMGSDGVGVAWLVSQTVVATATLALRRYWLPDNRLDLRSRREPTSSAGFPRRGRLGELRPVGPGMLAQLDSLTSAEKDRLRLHAIGRTAEVAASLLHLDDEPVAVVKKPLNDQGGAELRREHEAITSLQTALGDRTLREVVPRSRWIDAEGGYAIQEWIPGTSGADLARRCRVGLPQLMSSSLATLGHLHAATAHLAMVDEATANRWLGTRLEHLAAAGSVAAIRRRRSRIELLREVLLHQLVDTPVLMGQAHNDLWLGALLFDDDHRLRALLNWGRSVTGEPVAVDACTLGLTTWAACTGHSVGAVTVRAMQADGWRTLLRGHLGLDRTALRRHDGLPESTEVLLSWLHHVSNNIERSGRYRDNPLWLRDNVDRVLGELEKRAPALRRRDAARAGFADTQPARPPSRPAPATQGLRATRRSDRDFAPSSS